MNIAVVTGSGGLIGSEAVQFFATKGFTVVGIDNDLRSTFFGPEASTRWSIDLLKEQVPNYVHVDGDIRELATLERVFGNYGADIRVVIHTAAQPSHDWAAREPFVDFSVNASGTLNLLEVTRKHSPNAVFIFTSTNKVYGDRPNMLPLIETETRWEMDPSHPFAARGIDESMSIDQTRHSLFGASKVAADVLVQEYGRYFGMKTACFRGGCLTGPNHSGTALHGFLSYLVKCALTGEPYTVCGYKGKQVRDNIHAYDLVQMFWHFYQNPRAGEVYNAGGGRHSHCSMLEAIALVKDITGRDVRWTYKDTPRAGDHIWWVSDTSKFQRHYPQWRQTHDIRSIIEEVAGGLQKRIDPSAPVADLLRLAPGIAVRTVDRCEDIKEVFGFVDKGVLLEPDIDSVENECELFSRKRRDGEVLATIAANITGSALDLGTSHGRSAYKLATNISEAATVYTVNILPEQVTSTSGKLLTHLLAKEDIGSYYRQHGVSNITQIYADTSVWEMPPEIRDLGMVFVDGAHDTDIVYSDSKKAFERLRDGGFILWHDFCPALRERFEWIDACMRGVERFCAELGEPVEIVHLRNSWIGVLQKRVTAQPRVMNSGSRDEGGRLKNLKFVIAYPSYSASRQQDDERLIHHVRSFGYDVEGFPIPCPEGWWPFDRLDKAWRQKDSRLIETYAKLHRLMESKDVLISSGGSMLHPEFLATLNAVTVSVAADDPESSDILTKPVIHAFDLALTVNPACVEMYRSWGAQRAGWIFSPVLPEMMDPSITEQSILEGDRDVDIIFLGARVTPVEDRAIRLADLLHRFPQAVLGGPGWPRGPLEPKHWYPRTKIGWNFTNNTVGPNNTRTWHLPALGVMQICDNKAQLSKVFQLDREVVGYDTLSECREKTLYYLHHDSERREIARNGWKRATTHYTLDRWWQALLAQLAPSVFPPAAPAQMEITVSEAGNNPIVARDSRPKVALLVDRPGWAYDHAARAIATRLNDEFEFKIFYVVDRPDLSSWDFDLLHVFFWGETYHRSFAIDPAKIVKEVSSHRWALEEGYGKLEPQEMCTRYLDDATTLTATSTRLQELIAPYREILHVPNGVDCNAFRNLRKRSGRLVVGWAGNAKDPCKGVSEILVPAAGKDFTLRIAGGDQSHDDMRAFYNSIDVLCVASTAEGEPLTLLEAMACGCFPVCVDVGIVPEVIQHGRNGLIVERSVAAFRAAFQWCAANTEFIRNAGNENASLVREKRDWSVIAPLWRNAFRIALDTKHHGAHPAPPPAKDWVWHNNLGDTLLEWPGRAEVAGKLIHNLPLGRDARLLDLGSGHQTLRRYLPPSIAYEGFDKVSRVPGTRVLDLESDLPLETADVVSMLGVLEYLDDGLRIFRWASKHARYFLFSMNDCTDEAARQRQHWKCRTSFKELERWIRELNGRVNRRIDLGKKERVYLVEFSPQNVAFSTALKPHSSTQRTLALLSAGVNGDNSGDALIEDATRRLLNGFAFKTFPLLTPLTPEQLEEINACDAAIICGTNLYQHVFACSLTPSVIRAIRVPIVPIGIGGSAPIGNLPVMDPEGIRAVRMIHERCSVGSVRDPLSLRFVENIGVRNAVLTGCPVLFHAGREPVFTLDRKGDLTVSVRARLLHVDERLVNKEHETLDRLGAEFKPSLLLQSPYDFALAEPIAKRHGLRVFVDSARFGSEVMVDTVKGSSRTFGFRLHFGMLALSYGKPASFVATDTRTSEFCTMMGLPYHDMARYSIDDVVQELRVAPEGLDVVSRRWRELNAAMQGMLAANGLTLDEVSTAVHVPQERAS